jgi:hypothetical protein
MAGAEAFQRALASAPGEVQLAEGGQISGCLVPNQAVGELTEVGSALVSAATALAERTRSGQERQAATELGFLVGASERGAEDTGGIHAELTRRLAAAAQTGLTGAAAPVRHAYEKGYAAGQNHG